MASRTLNRPLPDVRRLSRTGRGSCGPDDDEPLTEAPLDADDDERYELGTELDGNASLVALKPGKAADSPRVAGSRLTAADARGEEDEAARAFARRAAALDEAEPDEEPCLAPLDPFGGILPDIVVRRGRGSNFGLSRVPKADCDALNAVEAADHRMAPHPAAPSGPSWLRLLPLLFLPPTSINIYLFSPLTMSVPPSSTIRDPPPSRWSLSIYTSQPAKLPLLDSDPSLPHSVVFIPGLTDTFGTCPYLDRLAAGVAPYGFSVVQLQLSSSLGGFGVCSLEGDAQEIARGVSWLREKRGKDKVVLMGHSTGCQDAMAYLSHPNGAAARGEKAIVDGVVLQAPVSDRESWENEYARESSEVGKRSEKEEGKDASGEGSSGSSSSSASESSKEEARKTLRDASRLVEEGKGSQLLPRDVPVIRRPGPDDTEQLGNVDAVNDSPMTAYRYWSLFAKGGEDDYFSTADLSQKEIRDIWATAGKGLREGGTGYVLALVGGEDEYIPRPRITPEGIVETYKQAAQDGEDEGLKRCRFEVLMGANHKCEAAEAQLLLVAKVRELIKAMGVPLRTGLAAGSAASRTGAAPPARRPPPSLSKGIPAWQLADAPAPAAAPAQPSAAESAGAPGASTAGPNSPSSSIPPHPPSFDALVELIATGRTDEIQGIRDIPLKINEEEPSESKLEARRKPWETQQAGGQSEGSEATM